MDAALRAVGDHGTLEGASPSGLESCIDHAFVNLNLSAAGGMLLPNRDVIDCFRLPKNAPDWPIAKQPISTQDIRQA